MAFIEDVVEGIIRFVFHLIVEVVFFYTGEIILYVLTLGRKVPRWDFYSRESPFRWAVLTEISWWIGFLFWVFTIGWTARRLFA